MVNRTSFENVSDGDMLSEGYFNDILYVGPLGEVKMFALSVTNAVTKAALQSKGWAICDGTTPAAQGISDPSIITTPNLEHKFIRMSNDETSGSTGGSENDLLINGSSSASFGVVAGGIGNGATPNWHNPPYYELAFFIKVK